MRQCNTFPANNLLVLLLFYWLPAKKKKWGICWMDNSQKCTGGQWNFFASEIRIFPGNMQQWQVNQREHLFTSQGRERELDGLLSMQTQAAQGNIYSFRPGWGPVPEGGPVPCLESSCAQMHALAKQTQRPCPSMNCYMLSLGAKLTTVIIVCAQLSTSANILLVEWHSRVTTQ